MSFLLRALSSLSSAPARARGAALTGGDPDAIAPRLFDELGKRWSPLTDAEEARRVIEDAIVLIPSDQVAAVLSRALLDLYGPSFTEEVGGALGRAAHMREREDLAEVLRGVEGQ